MSKKVGRLAGNAKKSNAHAHFVLERNPRILNQNQSKAYRYFAETVTVANMRTRNIQMLCESRLEL